ncbi:MAG: TonB-dependent receptor [Planctomycetes bacterium]|nr:TonB-dependent receptor [Planctomycetota bacterium]
MTRRVLFVGLLALALGAPAAAQEPPAGRLDVFAFGPDGAPLAGLEVEAGPVRGTTGKDGIARLVLPPGQHPVVVRQAGRALAQAVLPVVWGEATEVIVTVPRDGPARLHVEAPAWPEAPAGPPPEAGAALGTLAGRVKDERTGAPVAGARVLVRGHMGEARSGPDGSFELPGLPAGAHTVSVIHTQYATLTLPAVDVPAGGRATVEVALTPSALELDALRVTGYRLEGGLAALLQERREARGVTEVLGAEQIGKSGDGNAAEALKRVTGLTVVGGRYVYVRGMGERYSSALLNGSTLPSPDPERRVVPLDLFPADVIESISVQKTYTPDLPGDFGGGATKIKTKRLPQEFGASFSVSSAWNSASTFEDGLTYRGGARDWLGRDDGTRALPLGVRIATEHGPLHLEDPDTGDGYPLGVLTALGQTMPNVWSAQRKRDLPPDLGVSATVGDRYKTAFGTVGFTVGANYDHDWRVRRGVTRVFGVGGEGVLEPIVDYRVDRTTRSIDTSGLAAVGWEPTKGQELGVTTLWVRTSEDETEVYGGYLGDNDRDVRVTSLSWVEEQLLVTQAHGKHDLLAGIALSWTYAFALATRDQPDWRRSRYDLDPAQGVYLLSNRPEGNQRLYNTVRDDNHDISLSLDVPLPLWRDLTGNLQVGAGHVWRDRESETRRFKFIHRGERSRDPLLLARPPEEVFARENIAEDGFSFEEITRATDNYDAEQTIRAAFVNLTLPLTKALELSAGVRVERSRQQVRTFELFSRTPTAQAADLDTTDWLPAVSLVWRFTETMQARAAYSRTLARPDFRELSSAPFDQVIGAGVFIGNPGLDRTRIDNLDLRWEWYLSADEAVSIGLFYKDLTAPIETIILAGATRTVTLENAKGGRNLGLELEGRKRLGFLHGALEPLFVGGNLSLIRSEVELSDAGIATRKHRPLAGQSAWVVNASVGWDDPESRTSLAFLYNVAGERLVGVGTFGLPDIYERPFHRLDVVASWGFTEHWTLKLKVENVLGSKVRFEQGGQTTDEFEVGRTVGVSISGKF